MLQFVFTFGILAVILGLQNAVLDGIDDNSKSEIVDCLPESIGLSEGASLSDRAGVYRLTIVEVVGNSSKRSVSGSLTLQPQIPDLDSLKSVSTPLYGYTDVDLKSVGAYRVGNPGSRDPVAPGVLVLESDRDGRRTINLRFGSEANRRDTIRYDGAYTVLNVHRIDADGFSGGWRSGLRLARSKGYFCARSMP